MRTARRERAFDDFTPEWVDFLRKHLQVPAFIEHGIWLALASAARDTLSDTVTHCVALEAAMKQRQAQAYLLYGMDLEEQFGDFPVERARESWLRDDPWQPVRRYVERLRATPDWGERVMAINVCFEPLVGLLVRRELLMRSVRFNGDILTQAISHAAQLEWEWTRAWTVELIRFLLRRRRARAANRDVLARVAGGLDAARGGGGAGAAAGVRGPPGRDPLRRRARERRNRHGRAVRGGRLASRRDRGGAR